MKSSVNMPFHNPEVSLPLMALVWPSLHGDFWHSWIDVKPPMPRSLSYSHQPSSSNAVVHVTNIIAWHFPNADKWFECFISFTWLRCSSVLLPGGIWHSGDSACGVPLPSNCPTAPIFVWPAGSLHADWQSLNQWWIKYCIQMSYFK